MNNHYWHHKQDIPDAVKQRLKTYAQGKIADEIEIGGCKKKLLLVDAQNFRQAFDLNREYLYKGDFTAPSNENHYENARNFLTEDGLGGFALTDDGWLVSLYSNYTDSGFCAKVKHHIIAHAYKLVCIVANHEIESPLVQLYEKELGFHIFALTVDDSKIMTEYSGEEFMEHFKANYGVPSHVFMISKDALTDVHTIESFGYYFDAEDFVNRTVKKGK